MKVKKNMITQFEDSVAWQKARVLTKEVYELFGQCKDYGFRDQITRAVVSIMNNIAEGFERQTNKEFKQFLFIAKGSSGEVRSMLYAGLDCKYISEDQFKKMYLLSQETSRVISGLIKTL